MNEERTSKNDGKRRKRSKREVKYPKFPDENSGHQHKDRVGGVTQDRLTCKSGIFTIGKMSIPMHRGVKISEEIAQAKANQDLKKILNLANENAEIQFSSVTKSPNIVETNVEKKKSTVFSTPKSHPSVLKSMSSAGLSTQLSADTDMKSPLGEEAPTLISNFLKTKQKEIFPIQNYLEDAISDLRQKYKHMTIQSNVDFHAQQQTYAVATTMQNTPPKIKPDDNLTMEMPHASPKLVSRDENIILDIFASPKGENINFPNEGKPPPPISHYKQQAFVTNLESPPQSGYRFPVKNECSNYNTSPKCNLMEWDSNAMFDEAIGEKGKRIRLEPSPTLNSRLSHSSPSDISICAPSQVSSTNLPTFEPTPSPRFYRYKLC